MVRISRGLQRRLIMLVFDFVISAGALVLTSKVRSHAKWKSTRTGPTNTGKPVSIKTERYKWRRS